MIAPSAPRPFESLKWIESKGDSMNLNGILIGSENPQRLRDYYMKLFGKPTWDEGGFFGWQVASGSMMIGQHDHVKGKKQRARASDLEHRDT